MNPYERTFIPVAAPPAAGRNRLRWIAAIVAGVLVVGAAGLAGAWYFTRCGDCGRSPILCTDPCKLPTYG